MTAAIFGLIGVVVGGVVNGLITYTLEKQREKRAVRAAARLLMDPLQSIGAELELVLQLHEWAWLRHKELDAVAALWNQHRDLLASHGCPYADWRAIVEAFQAVRALYTLSRDQVATEVWARLDDGAMGLTEMVRILNDNKARIEAGRLVLEGLAGN